MTEIVAEGPPPPPITATDGTHELRLEPAPVTPVVEAVVESEDEAEDEADEISSAPKRRRKLHRIRTRPWRTTLMAAMAIGVAIALPLLGLLAARTIANSREGRAVEPTVPVGQLPSTPASVLVGLDRAGRPASITVMSVAASGSGGTVVIMPLSTAAYLDGLAKPKRLDAAYELEGLDGQARAVGSVLGVSTTAAQEVDADGLAALLEPYTPVSVTLDTPVLDSDDEGTTTELFPAGDVTLSARDAARLLLARVDGESELARVPRAEALWRAMLAGPGGSATVTSTVTSTAGGTSVASGGAGSAPSDLAGFLRAVSAGPVGVEVLRVQPAFDPADPGAAELLQADVAYLRLLVASVMPGAVSPSNGNISFRVINPLGDPTYAYRAVGRLAAVQANVVLVTETSGPVPDRTVVIWHSPAGEVQAGAFAPVLGATAPTASEERIDGIDATVILGRDFPGYLAAEDAKVAPAPTTSTTTVPTTTTTIKKGKG